MLAEIIFAGFGGQGVLLAGQTLAKCAMWHGLEVSWIPSYGPEMRGGTANCTVVLADAAIASPMALQYDYAVLFNQPSHDKFMPKMKDGGVVLYDSATVKPVARDQVTLIPVEATRIADELGSLKCTNMVMLGALIKKLGTPPVEQMTTSFSRIFTGKKSSMLDLNLKAFQKGVSCI
jgi:2-oxoglutarate ferredoxin oxidoreductase subunit gamma